MGRNEMKFDMSARLEIWVTEDQIREHEEYEDIVGDKKKSLKERVESLKALARDICYEYMREINKTDNVDFSFDITAEVGDPDSDDIDWEALALGEVDLDKLQKWINGLPTGRIAEMVDEAGLELGELSLPGDALEIVDMLVAEAPDEQIDHWWIEYNND